jgi:4-amino-4-deoxy-L-arabinose transferase-like glycosyltransferase
MIGNSKIVVGGAKDDSAIPSGYWTLALLIFGLWALFSNLGEAALFEPDEGRNAEIAREILLLDDWVTPHYDFIPRLDKPISYFSLVAISYKVFGVSEWSARLPSALAALGSVFLTYGLARSLYGRWAALWSAMVLLTSIEFFGLGRIVILDMVFTVSLTATFCCFVIGARAVERGKGRMPFLLMYVAMGAATLVKGPIGFLLPGAVIFVHLLFTRRWTLLRNMELPLGAVVFMVTAGPWYVLAELRNPGYLRYFIFQENIVRFVTTRFNRTGPWYFFLLVLGAGFFPWTALLPRALFFFIAVRSKTNGCFSSYGPLYRWCFSLCRLRSCRIIYFRSIRL